MQQPRLRHLENGASVGGETIDKEQVKTLASDGAKMLIEACVACPPMRPALHRFGAPQRVPRAPQMSAKFESVLGRGRGTGAECFGTIEVVAEWGICMGRGSEYQSAYGAYYAGTSFYDNHSIATVRKGATGVGAREMGYFSSSVRV